MDNRRELRLSNAYTTIVQLAAASPEGDSPEVAICHCVDISSDGLQVTVGEKVEAGRILSLTIITDSTADDHLVQPDDLDQQNHFHLIAEVIWSGPSDKPGEYRMGLELLPSIETQIIQWKQWVLELLLDGSIEESGQANA